MMIKCGVLKFRTSHVREAKQSCAPYLKQLSSAALSKVNWTTYHGLADCM